MENFQENPEAHQLAIAVCWGFENNCTRKLSSKDPLQIVLLKGIFSGLGSIVIGLCILLPFGFLSLSLKDDVIPLP